MADLETKVDCSRLIMSDEEMRDYIMRVKPHIGNYATSFTFNSVQYTICAEVDPHDDSDTFFDQDPTWKIKIHGYDPDYIMFHHKEGEVVVEELSLGKIIEFDYKSTHGLVHRDRLDVVDDPDYLWALYDKVPRIVFEFIQEGVCMKHGG